MQLSHIAIFGCILSICSLYSMEQHDSVSISDQYILTLPPELGHEIVGWLNPYTSDLKWISRVSGVDKQWHKNFSPIIKKMYACHQTLQEHFGSNTCLYTCLQFNKMGTRAHHIKRDKKYGGLTLVSYAPNENSGELTEYKKELGCYEQVASKQKLKKYIKKIMLASNFFYEMDFLSAPKRNLYEGEDNTIVITTWHVSKGGNQRYIQETKTYYSLDLVNKKENHAFYTDIEKEPILTSDDAQRMNINSDDLSYFAMFMCDPIPASKYNYYVHQLDGLELMELISEEIPEAMQRALTINNKEMFMRMLDAWIICGTKSIQSFPQKGTTVYADGLKNIYTLPNNLTDLPKPFHRLTADDARQYNIQIINKGASVDTLETEIQNIFSSSENTITGDTSDAEEFDESDGESEEEHSYYTNCLRYWEGPTYFGGYNNNLVSIAPDNRNCGFSTISTIRFNNNQWNIRDHSIASKQPYCWLNAPNIISYMDDTNTILKNKYAEDSLIVYEGEQRKKSIFNLLLTEQTIFPRYYQLKSSMPWYKTDYSEIIRQCNLNYCRFLLL